MSGVWASGSWQVTDGKVDEFVKRWEEFVGSANDKIEGFEWARLTRDVTDPNHFVSFASWTDEGARKQWMDSDGFTDGLEACRALCDEFRGGGYDEVLAVG